MAAPFMEVRGLAEVRASMRRAGMDMQELKDAHAKVARIAENAIRAAAPKVSGRLAGTIRSSGTLRAAIVRAGRASAPYPGPNNWGWPADSGPRGSKSGIFWMQAGAQASQPAWVNVYAADIQRICDTVEGI